MSTRKIGRIFIFLLLLGGAGAATPQVRQIGGTQEARLSGHCQSVRVSDQTPLMLGDVRVRSGGNAHVTGLRQSVFVDAGGQAQISATAAFIYVAKGGQATVGGQRNHVYAEQGGKVLLVGQVTLVMVDVLELQVHRNATACQ